MAHDAPLEHFKLFAWDFCVIGTLVDMLICAIFDVALDIEVALDILIGAGIGLMYIFIGSYVHVLTKTWYKQGQRTMHLVHSPTDG